MIRERISPAELHALEKVRIVDIRKNPDDYQIPGSLRHEGNSLERESVPFGLNEEIVIYCGTGNSSNRVATNLRERGYNASALDGGYQAWVEAGFDTEPRMG